MLMWQSLKAASDIWLSIWTSFDDSDNNLQYFGIYSALSLSSTIFIFFRIFALTRGIVKLSKNLHDEMITKVVNAPINLFHDRTPKGQIYNRMSNDLENLQSNMFNVGNMLVAFFQFIGSIVICSYFQAWSLIFIPFILVTGYFIAGYYLKGAQELKRIEGISKSPILNIVGESIPGAMIIRAYKYEELYFKKFFTKVDDLFKVNLFSAGASNWFGQNLDLLSFTFSIFLIVFVLVFEDSFTPQGIGLMLTYSLLMQNYLNSLLINFGVLSNNMVSMERCLEYTKIETETTIKPITVPNSWPQQGAINFTNYSVRYRPDSEIVLKNLNFKIEGGEKLGIVGRTGSGKSTICMSLFRILEAFEGEIQIDNINIAEIDLKILRSNLTIIPQDPNLMKGSLKYNIDPLNLYSDELIIEAIKSIGFNYFIENSKTGLELMIEENGDNLSVGEKQLICIARAILRKSKIVVMDEATANIDHKTEDIIQKAITNSLKTSTIITIAHRIKTILSYDRIVVLEKGEIIEVGAPSDLIKDESSYFYQLYTKSHF